MNYSRQNPALILVLVLCALIAASVLFWGVSVARGAQVADQPALVNQFRATNVLASTTFNGSTVLETTATTTNATSTNMASYADSTGAIFDGSFDGRGIKRLDVYMTRGGVFGAATLGTSTFAVQGFDGVNWQYVNRMLLATTSPTASFGVQNGVFGSDPNLGSTNVPTIGDTNGSTVDATTTVHLIIDATTLNYQKYRCIATRTVDGSNSCQFTGTF